MSKVIARFRVDPPKHTYAVYAVSSGRVIDRYYSRRAAKRAAREMSETFVGREYWVVEEDTRRED